MTLYFIDSGPRYSTYRDKRGEVIFIANGGMRRMLTCVHDVHAAYQAHQNADEYVAHLDEYLDDSEWVDYIREYVLDEYLHIGFCDDCNAFVVGNDEAHEVGRDGNVVCSSCYRSYDMCADCDIATEDTSYTLHDERVCERCRERNYYYCEDCGGYYHGESDDNHAHDQSCDCESPEQHFFVANAGERLGNDEETVVTLPAGVISDEGMSAIAQLIWSAAYEIRDNPSLREKTYAVAQLPVEVGAEWQTKTGNFTKRLSKLAYQKLDYKIDADLLGKIGTVAREHSSTVTEVVVAVTRDLNRSPEEFGNEGSCWWSDYARSRCALKSNGGFGLRSFDPDNRYEPVSGRVWVMPLKLRNDKLTPTFNTTDPDAYIVFNGYGVLEGYTGARVMAQMTGMSYRKVGFDSSPMYVNSSSGYLVASENVIKEHGQHHMRFSLTEHASLHHTESYQEVSNVA